MSFDADIMKVHAYHEAGHAVVAWSLNVPLLKVEIDANGGFCTHALTLSPSFDPELRTKGDCAKAEKRALILLGGEMAELVGGEMAQLEGDGEMAQLFCDARVISLESVVPGSDREELKEMVKLVFGNLGPKPTDWISSAEVRVEKIVIDNWKRICSLGNALIEKRVLSGDEATQIIQEG